MPIIPFHDTRVAFAHRTNSELKKAALMFKSFHYPLLIKYGPGIANTFIGVFPFVKSIIKKSLFSHFCGGESIEECRDAMIKLCEHNVGAILDYSVEGEEKEIVFNQTRDEILHTIDTAKNNRSRIPFSVFKVTGIGRMALLTKVNAGEKLNEEEEQEFEKVRTRFFDIC